MQLYDVVTKLVGPIQPVGDSGADKARLENLEKMTELVDRLLFDISAVAPNAYREEASMKAIGTHARDFMDSVRGS